jgi:hypothetical protein
MSPPPGCENGFVVYNQYEENTAPPGRYFRRSDIVQARSALEAINQLGARPLPQTSGPSAGEQWILEVHYLSPYCPSHIIFRGEEPPERATRYFQVYGVEEINGSAEDDSMAVFDDVCCQACLEDLMLMVETTPGAALRTMPLEDVQMELGANGQVVYTADPARAVVVPSGVPFAPPGTDLPACQKE